MTDTMQIQENPAVAVQSASTAVQSTSTAVQSASVAVQTEPPLITVLTVALNAEATIARTIESVLGQSYARVEYIILDGMSEDRTVEVASSYADAFAARGYSFRIVRRRDGGMYEALNYGVTLAGGDLVGQINADDWYEPDALSLVAEAFMRENFDYAWGNLRVHTKKGEFIKHAKNGRLAVTRHWNHPTTFIRAEVYRENPYSLLSMYDDFELILRLRRKKCRACVIDHTLADFTFGGMSTHHSLREMFHRIRLRQENYRRNRYSRLYWFDSFITEFLKYIRS